MAVEGRKDEGASAAAGSLPEGAEHDEGRAEDSSLSDELQTFPRGSKSAGTLDLAAANDEPTQLIRCLVMAANENLTESEHMGEWQVLLRHFQDAEKELQRLQQPSQKSAR